MTEDSQAALEKGGPTHMLRRRQPTICSALICLIAAFHSGTLGGQTVEAAQSALNRGDYSSAEKDYRQLLARQPDSPELWTNLGTALQAQGESTPAIHAFQRALQLHYLPNTYALLAAEKCKVHDMDGARPMLSRILHEQNTNARLLGVVAPCYLELDEPLESIQVYQQLINQPFFPDDLARIQLIRSYLKAAQHFMQVLETSPGATPYVDAIEKARDSGSENARSAFSLAERSSPYFSPNLDFPEALKVWRDHPQDPALLYLLSVLCGEEIFKQVTICGDQYQNSRYFLQFRADTLANLGHLDEAAAMYRSLIQHDPQLPDLRYSLGMIYVEKEQWSMALEVFRLELVSYPGDERAANRASECLIALQSYRELRTFLQPWANKDNSPLWAHLDLATAYEKLNDSPAAIKELETAEQLNPDDKKIRFRLLLLYRKSGNVRGVAREASALGEGHSDLSRH